MSEAQHYVGEGETTRRDTEKRVTRAEDLLATQYSSAQIVRALCEEFGVVERTAFSYLKLAWERLQAETNDEARALRKARARTSWQQQYRRCIERGDMAAANYALDRLCRLDGLFEAQKHEFTVNASLTVQMEIRAFVGVLDAHGLEALDVIQAQIEAAQAKGLLPSGKRKDPIDAAIEAEVAEDKPKKKRKAKT